jgi:hypothetical protein
MTTVHKWKIHCSTEGAWQEVWSPDEPTVCPNNNSHTVTASSAYIVQSIDEAKVQINEEETPVGSAPTGGYYRLFSRSFDCPPNSTTTDSFVFEYPVAIIAGFMNTSLTMKGDIISIDCGKDTTIGALTADVTTGDTVINVSSTVTANVKRGRHVRFIDGGTVTDYHLVVGVDSAAGTITLASGGCSHSLTAATPTLIQMTIKYAENVELSEPGMYTIGTNKIGASYVPAGIVLTLTYVNNSADEKRPSWLIECLY